MAEQDFFTYTPEELENQVNIAWKLLVYKLHRDGYISNEDYDNIIEEYYIMLKRPSKISEFWAKIFGKRNDYEYSYIPVTLPKYDFDFPDDDPKDSKLKLKVLDFKKDDEEKE